MTKITPSKREVEEARAKVDEELFRINNEIHSRVEQRKRLEEERQRLSDLMNDVLAAELESLRNEVVG